jgi:hypothetical protein
MRSLYSGLSAYWPLYEASGTRSAANNTLFDLADHNTCGQSAGRVLSAAHFTAASSQWLDVADNAALRGGNRDFTFQAWVYADSFVSSFPIIFSKDASGSNSEYDLIYLSSRFTFLLYNGVATQVGSAVNNTLGAPSTATWYHILCWHDSVAAKVFIRTNDAFEDSAATTGTAGTGTQATQIGRNGGAGVFWDGRICEVAFWTRLLVPQEKTYLYNNGFGRGYPFDGRPALAMLGRDTYKHLRREVGLIR